MCGAVADRPISCDGGAANVRFAKARMAATNCHLRLGMRTQQTSARVYNPRSLTSFQP